MADRGETAYNISTLHFVFALSSIALLGSLGWLLYADYNREWKDWQKKFRDIEIQKVEAEIRAANVGRENKPLDVQIAEKEKEVTALEEQVASTDKEYKDLLKQLEMENGRVYATEQVKKFAKAEEDSVRYEVEMYRFEHKDPMYGEERLQKAVEKSRRTLVEYQTSLQLSKDIEAKIAQRLASVNTKKSDLASMRRELDRLSARKSDLTSLVKQQIMNAPGLDFIAPTLAVKKIVLEGLFVELNFTRKKRIDMCQTCHVAIDMPGFETHSIARTEGEPFAPKLVDWVLAEDVVVDKNKVGEKGKVITKEMATRIAAGKDVQTVKVELPQPLRSHPRLDLYLSASSPHAIDAYGCTVCHRGSGESVGFVTSDHAPETYHASILEGAGSEVEKFKKNEEHSEAVKSEWEKKYHWHKQHHWDYPMLGSSYTEASCLQCHKDSMETIREAAPTLYKGWQTIEEKGCYSCHKIQGWRDNRRPGPSLVTVAAKLKEDFVHKWIENPKDFRPSTRMPQIFHLENTVRVPEPVKPDADIIRGEIMARATFAEKQDAAAMEQRVKSAVEARNAQYAQRKKDYDAMKALYDQMGRDYTTKVWDDVAIASVVKFIFNRSQSPAIAPPPVKGDAEKGKAQFQGAGCLACHNLGELGKENPYGEYGPDLAGIGSKVTEDWIYQWIKNPHAWWKETRMPNLNLADDEAANIAAYLATQKKENWNPVRPPLDVHVLEREAMTFLTSKYSLTESELRLKQIRDGNFGGTPNDPSVTMDPKLQPEAPLKGDEAVSYFLGERWISRQGCFSCHTMRGLEDYQSIGVELTEWGTKEVEKLDFGLLEHLHEVEVKFGPNKHPYMNLPGSPTAGRELANGLDHTSRVQWIEQKLRAPRSYDRGRDKAPLDIWRMPYFGLTEEEIHAVTTYVIGLVREGDVDPSRKMAMTEARTAIEKGWENVRSKNCIGCHIFEHEKVVARQDGKEVNLSGLVTLDDPADDTISVQLWEPAPDFSKDPEETKPGAIANIERTNLVSRKRAYGGGIFPALAKHLQEANGWGLSEAVPRMPPVLAAEGDKVRAPWTFGFLKEPYIIRPIVKIHMPNFEMPDADAKALSTFFTQRHIKEHAKRVSLDTRQQLRLTSEELAAQSRVGDPAKIRSAEAGVTPNQDTYDRLVAFAKDKKINTPSLPGLLEYIREREPAYRAEREAENSKYFEQAWNMMALATAGNCYSCHFRGSEKPTGLEASWAPDLTRVRERLRTDWVHRWLIDPQSISPGTLMPTPGDFSNIMPGADRSKQLKAATDFLMNWEFLMKFMKAN